MKGKKDAEKIYSTLEMEYPSASTELHHKNVMQLLVATILSAQCTDVRVNMVTKDLFKKYKNAADFAGADRDTFETEIRSTGFYRNKAKNILRSARIITEEYGGKVPSGMEQLIALPGVARKTANIVLCHGYGKIEGIAVDTHVKRVSARLGFTDNTDPVKIEKDLMRLFDSGKWGDLSNVLILHGRKICAARKPLCSECAVGESCPSRKDYYP